MRSATQIWLVRVISMRFLRSFLESHFTRKPVVASQNVGCFLSVPYEYACSDVFNRQQLGKLKYLLMCIKESSRIFAPVPMTGRTLDKAYEIDGHLIPEGSGRRHTKLR